MVSDQDFMVFYLDDTMGITIEKFTIGFQMDDTVGIQYVMVFLSEFRVGQTMFGTTEFDLRIWKCNPDFAHFIFSKGIVDQFDLGA